MTDKILQAFQDLVRQLPTDDLVAVLAVPVPTNP